MATVRRHPVPESSYEPDRPLNDLGREQLSHFIHAERRLPREYRTGLPEPSPEDGPACSNYIGAVTRALLAQRQERAAKARPGPKLVAGRKTVPKPRPQELALAAAADEDHPGAAAKKTTDSGKAAASKQVAKKLAAGNVRRKPYVRA